MLPCRKKITDMKQRLDTYSKLPSGMAEYLSAYGWHFSKKMAEWAISNMRDRDGAPVRMKDKESLTRDMKMHGIDTDNFVGYDAVFVEAMARSDYFGSSITDDVHIYKYVYDYLCDKDGYDGIALSRFYADCIGKGCPIYWEEML